MHCAFFGRYCAGHETDICLWQAGIVDRWRKKFQADIVNATALIAVFA
jgi:hypothetical protein